MSLWDEDDPILREAPPVGHQDDPMRLTPREISQADPPIVCGNCGRRVGRKGVAYRNRSWARCAACRKRYLREG